MTAWSKRLNRLLIRLTPCLMFGVQYVDLLREELGCSAFFCDAYFLRCGLMTSAYVCSKYKLVPSVSLRLIR